MRKIPTLFVRDPEDRKHVLSEITPGCEWVMSGEGVPTRKHDGTCLKFDSFGIWWARREVREGKNPPEGFEPVEHDPVTGKTVGWEVCRPSWSFWKYLQEAVGDKAKGREVRSERGGTMPESDEHYPSIHAPKSREDAQRRAWKAAESRHGPVIHECPPEGGDGLMPCCGKAPFEVPRWHRVTLDPEAVTCGK